MVDGAVIPADGRVRLVELGAEIVDRLDSDRQAHEVGVERAVVSSAATYNRETCTRTVSGYLLFRQEVPHGFFRASNRTNA